MMSRSFWRAGQAVLLAAIALLLLTMPALAHEHRTIGDYELVAGWANEPAFVDDANKISLRVTNLTTKAPVEGLEKTVKVEVGYGGRTKTYNLEPRFGQPGAYTADLLPTRSGDYIFRYTGTINGTPLDAKFDPADGEFDSVQAKTEIAFPEPPVAVNQIQDRALALEGGVRSAQSTASIALIAGLAGVVIGLAGLAVGLLTFRRLNATDRKVNVA